MRGRLLERTSSAENAAAHETTAAMRCDAISASKQVVVELFAIIDAGVSVCVCMYVILISGPYKNRKAIFLNAPP